MKLPEKIKGTVDTQWTEGSIPHTINQLIDYLEEREVTGNAPTVTEEEFNKANPVTTIIPTKTIALPKPEWWAKPGSAGYEACFKEALEATSKASGILFKLEN